MCRRVWIWDPACVQHVQLLHGPHWPGPCQYLHPRASYLLTEDLCQGTPSYLEEGHNPRKVNINVFLKCLQFANFSVPTAVCITRHCYSLTSCSPWGRGWLPSAAMGCSWSSRRMRWLKLFSNHPWKTSISWWDHSWIRLQMGNTSLLLISIY